MGQTTQTQTTTVPGATGSEARLQSLLQNLIKGQAGQLGDLSQIASGKFGVTEEDRRLIADSLGFTRDIVSRDIAGLSAEGQGRLGESLAARGIQGSSIESVDRAILERDLQRQGANLLDQSRVESNQALMQLPFQRAQTQIGANQALFQSILGAANPLLNSFLSSRLTNTTTTNKQSGGGLGQLVQLGGLIAAPFTGGASFSLSSLFGGGKEKESPAYPGLGVRRPQLGQ
jgi:hypothetical protein